VHGETLGLLATTPQQTWTGIGRELARLHTRVRTCPDPHGWLDHPDRELDPHGRVGILGSDFQLDPSLADDVRGWIDRLSPATKDDQPRCFLHNDLHAMNAMCTRDGKILALIDWGDAGWGDPALDFAEIPFPAVDQVVAAYKAEAPGNLDHHAWSRILWDKLARALRRFPRRRDLLGRISAVDARRERTSLT
jgi:aminoglycoside phosphotransferase (APT) family kinase protein